MARVNLLAALFLLFSFFEDAINELEDVFEMARGQPLELFLLEVLANARQLVLHPSVSGLLRLLREQAFLPSFLHDGPDSL